MATGNFDVKHGHMIPLKRKCAPLCAEFVPNLTRPLMTSLNRVNGGNGSQGHTEELVQHIQHLRSMLRGMKSNVAEHVIGGDLKGALHLARDINGTRVELAKSELRLTETIKESADALHAKTLDLLNRRDALDTRVALPSWPEAVTA